MRDWLKTLQRAYYGDAPFWVESDTIAGGRRLVVHEFPHRDDPYVEDMGRATVKISVTAYVAGDAADSEAARLRRACERGGAQRLQLPLETLTAHCESVSRDHNKDRLGYIAFSLSLVREGAGAAPYPAAYLARLVTVGVSGLAAPLAGLLARRFRGRGVAGYVREAAAAEIRNAAAALDAVRAAIEIDAEAGPEIARRIGDLYADAEQYAAVGDIADRWDDTAFAARQSAGTDLDLAAEIVAIADAIRESGSAPAAALAGLADYGPLDPGRAHRTPSRRQEAENAAALAQTVRVAAIAAAAAAIVDSDIADRRAAIAARARIVTMIDAELVRLSGPAARDVYLALVAIRDDAVANISRRMADLAPVIRVASQRPMPALWWSHRLYGTHARAGELVARNRVRHPGFMPRAFDALAS